jgi:hypothetical protein
MNRILLLTFGIIFSLTSCDQKKEEAVEFSIPKQILDNSSYIDSNFVVTNFKQGAFNIKYFHDTVAFVYNNLIFKTFTISKDSIPKDNIKWNKNSAFAGYWKQDSVSKFPIVLIKNNYIKQIKSEYEGIATPYNFDWDAIGNDGIKGFISFSEPFTYKTENMIALNTYSKAQYTMTLYSIPKDNKVLPERLVTLSFFLIGFEVEFEKGQVKNIMPNIIVNNGSY